MIEAFTIGTEGMPTNKGRVKKYILVWCAEGKIEMEIDNQSFSIPANHVITITSGQYHAFKETQNAKGLLIQFTYDFFCKDDSDIELIFQNGLFCHFDQNEVVNVSAYPSVGTQLDWLRAELEERPFQFLISIHARIRLILIDINRAKIQQGDEIWKPTALFLKFLELIRANFQHNLPVKHYAGILGTSESKLNELSKLFAGKTALQIIHGLIISEAKRLFFYEKLSVKEVAFSLGFQDPFYFSNFFKKHTKISPQEFMGQSLR